MAPDELAHASAPPAFRSYLRPATAQRPEATFAPAGGTQLYSIGEPTDEEQLTLELVNRARRDPAAEAARLKATQDAQVLGAYTFFGVDLNKMTADVGALAPAPPIAMNAELLAAARLHSQDMALKGYQAHSQTNANNQVTQPADRVRAQGYDYVALAENVFSYAKAIFYGYAALEVDWGGPAASGGMQDPPGHRLTIHDAIFREAGIGIVPNQHANVGPWVITQDFGTEANTAVFITGVAYYDFNGNGFYDLGEGIGGVRVDVPGSGFYALTPNSGGYAIPVGNDGAYEVRFSANALAPHQVNVSVANLDNVKADFMPAYSPPTVSGPDPAVVGQGNAYTFTPVGAATAYQWRYSKRVAATAIAGAESGLGDMTAETSLGYQVVAAGAAASGNYSFHLAHAQPVPQTLTWNHVFVPAANSALQFSSRLGLATADEVARVQVSTDAGASWQDLWTQAGSGGNGETSFTTRAVALAAFAGREVRFRFVYDLGLSYYPVSDVSAGWLLDDIRISYAEEVLGVTVSGTFSGTAFAFYPDAPATYALQVRPQVSGRFLDWGPVKLVSAQVGPNTTIIRLTNIEPAAAGQVQIDFELVAGTATQFQIESAPSPVASFAPEVGATVQPLAGNRFRALVQTAAVLQEFYRVRAN